MLQGSQPGSPSLPLLFRPAALCPGTCDGCQEKNIQGRESLTSGIAGAGIHLQKFSCSRCPRKGAVFCQAEGKAGNEQPKADLFLFVCLFLKALTGHHGLVTTNPMIRGRVLRAQATVTE